MRCLVPIALLPSTLETRLGIRLKLEQLVWLEHAPAHLLLPTLTSHSFPPYTPSHLLYTHLQLSVL